MSEINTNEILLEISKSLSSVETKLDEFLKYRKCDDHDKRIRRLEQLMAVGVFLMLFFQWYFSSSQKLPQGGTNAQARAVPVQTLK